MGLAELPPERRAAVSAAAERGDIAALVTLLKDEDWRVRQLATFALAEFSKTAAEPLIEALLDASLDPDTRGHAAIALRGSGDSRAFEALLVSLSDEAWQVRGYAAYALGGFRDARAVEPLIAALHADANEHCSVRNWVAQSLGEIGDLRAVEALRDLAANDPDHGVRATAKRSLHTILGETTQA